MTRMDERFLADEMLGRLTRYLRILGYDTEYVREGDDDAVRARAQREHRTLLTRDHALARRTSGSVLLRSPHLKEQLAELRTQMPGIVLAPRFDRCTRCNGELAELPASAARPPGAARPGPVYECRRCGHRYWEGSHTRQIREFLLHLGPT